MSSVRFQLLFILILGVACGKKPTSPSLSEVSYLFAISPQSGDGYSWIYYIDTSIDSLVDSISVPGDIPVGLGVSPKGDRLYLFTNTGPTQEPTHIEINPFTKQVLYQGQNSGVPTPDGRYLLRVMKPEEGLTVYNARSHLMLYHSDMGFQDIGFSGVPLAFDETRSLVYGQLNVRKFGGGKIGVFNYQTLHWERVIDLAQVGGFPNFIWDIVVLLLGRSCTS